MSRYHRALLILTALLLFLDLPSAEGRRRRSRKPRTGKLEILSTTLGAKVFVDGELVGKVPLLKPIELPVGEHSLKVYKRGYTDYLDTFKIKYRRTKTVQVDLIAFAGLLDVDSDIPGAVVHLDGKPVGTTPLETEVMVGKHTIRVTMPGMRDQIAVMTILAGSEFSFYGVMQPLTLAPAAQETPQAAAETPWYKEWWIWTAGGAALTLAIVLPIALTMGEDRPVDFQLSLGR